MKMIKHNNRCAGGYSKSAHHEYKP